MEARAGVSTPLTEATAERYVERVPLGAGAAGRVFLARDSLAAGRRVALKVVGAADASRLAWEFHVLKDLAHPHLAAVYELVRLPHPDASELQDWALVEEFVEGEAADVAARRLVADRAARLKLALRTGVQVAAALAAVHARGLVHGDVKPANIVVGAKTKLVDLGLSRRAGFYREVGGTPGFLAPELLVGRVGAGADVYALGVTLIHLLRAETGPASLSSGAGTGQALIQPPPACPTWVPEGVRGLLSTLTAPQLAARPEDALFVAGRLTQLLQAQGEALTVPLGLLGTPDVSARVAAVETLPLLGQTQNLEALGQLLRDGALLCAICGPRGSGRSRLVREAVSELQLSAVQDGLPVPSYVVLGEVPAAPPAFDAVVHLQAPTDLDGAARLAALLRAVELSDRRVTVLVESTEAVPGAQEISVSPLSPAEVATLLEGALTPTEPNAAVVEAVLTLTDGLAGRICALVQSAFEEGISLERADAWQGLAVRTLAGEDGPPTAALSLFDVLVICGGVVAREALALPLEDVTRQFDVLRRNGVAFAREGYGEIVLQAGYRTAALSDSRRLQAVSRVRAEALSVQARALLHLAQGKEVEAEPLLLQELARLRKEGKSERAAEFALAALQRSHSPGLLDQLRLSRADAQRAVGDYAGALSTLEPLTLRRAREGMRDESAVLRAEVLRLMGRRAEAHDVCRRQVDSDDSIEALAVQSRVELDEGNPERALEISAQVILRGGEDRHAHARALEVQALAHGIVGEHARARADAVANLERHAAGELQARAHATMAFVAALRGARDECLAHNRKAAELAEAAGEIHAAAVARVNAGSEALGQGALALALSDLSAGAVRLTRLGRQQDVFRALYNLAVARTLLGDFARAEAIVAMADAAAQEADVAEGAALLGSLRAEIALSRGQLRDARTLLSECDPSVVRAVHVAVIVRGRLVEVACGLELRAVAEQHLEALRAAAVGLEGAEIRAELALAAARVALLAGEGAAARVDAEQARGLAREADTFDLRLRSQLFAARCAQERGDTASAQALLSETRSMLERCAAGLAAEDLMRLRAAAPYQAAFAAIPTGSAPEIDYASRLLLHVRRFMAERRPSQLYERVLQAAIELSGVERGYLITVKDSGAVRVRAAFGLSRGAIARDPRALSSSIVGEVLRTGRPVATTDATTDLRLRGAESVHALALRSVAALPLVVGGEIRGAIYLEDRLRPSVFDEPLMTGLQDLSLLASQAIDAVEMLRRERQARRRLRLAQARLEEQVEVQAVELRGLREERREGAGAFGLVGQSPALLKALEVAGRVARSNLPALIYGESGTGKELVARAIHNQSERQHGPFVAENCSALPEPLLESALFGHMRGAFTGADRSRRGLFELADGGTLFLDEVGEMPLSMQVRLLRVLQEGEVQPVGAERPRKVDVRVVAATHRNLPEMVKSGAFRQDLYYRLAVVALTLPPLRDRRDDIPELAATFAARYAPDRSVQMERKALQALCAYDWPGNVRQLENEIRRALLMADDRIALLHLSPELRSGPDGPEIAPLDLHAQVAALEQRLVIEALSQTGGNQTRAAERLGISRYGLIKMIKRLGIEAS